jgi:hypothetical protein
LASGTYLASPGLDVTAEALGAVVVLPARPPAPATVDVTPKLSGAILKPRSNQYFNRELHTGPNPTTLRFTTTTPAMYVVG